MLRTNVNLRDTKGRGRGVRQRQRLFSVCMTDILAQPTIRLPIRSSINHLSICLFLSVLHHSLWVVEG